MRTDILIDTYGTKIGCSGKRIVLSFPGIKEKKEYPASRVEKIIILRPASLTTHAVRLALEYDIDIVYLGNFGKPIGRIFSSEPKGLAQLRRSQLESSLSDASMHLAKCFVDGKCSNQMAFLRHLAEEYGKNFDGEIAQAEALLGTVQSLPNLEKNKEQLLGIEGHIAERYFSALRKLFRFPGRKPQGRDKFNSALNYGYGILYNEVERAALYVGLDPYLGLYHRERYGKPALVLDLVEEFRVPVIDSVIIPLYIEKKLGKKSDFVKIGKQAYQLSERGKRIVVETVFKRLNQTVIWHKKRYTMKAAMENQIRMLGRFFMGKEKKYIPFHLRQIERL